MSFRVHYQVSELSEFSSQREQALGNKSKYETYGVHSILT